MDSPKFTTHANKHFEGPNPFYYYYCLARKSFAIAFYA